VIRYERIPHEVDVEESQHRKKRYDEIPEPEPERSSPSLSIIVEKKQKTK
jgi:hypothetical protein